VPDRPRKSVGSETTFAQDLGRPAEIEEGVLSVLDDVWGYCERTGVAGRTVTVKIKYADFQIVTRSRTLPAVVASRKNSNARALSWCARFLPLEKRSQIIGRVDLKHGGDCGAGRNATAATDARTLGPCLQELDGLTQSPPNESWASLLLDNRRHRGRLAQRAGLRDATHHA